MGYFSRESVELEYEFVDKSYPTPQMQLRWRLEDLEAKLEEMSRGGHCGYDSCGKIPVNELLVTDVGYISDVNDIMLAIEMAKQELAIMYAGDENNDIIEIQRDIKVSAAYKADTSHMSKTA